MSNPNKKNKQQAKEEVKAPEAQTPGEVSTETETVNGKEKTEAPKFNALDELKYLKDKIEATGEREVDLAVESAHKAIDEAIRWLAFISNATAKKKK